MTKEKHLDAISLEVYGRLYAHLENRSQKEIVFKLYQNETISKR